MLGGFIQEELEGGNGGRYDHISLCTGAKFSRMKKIRSKITGFLKKKT